MSITLADKFEEAMRELRLRRRAFPVWVKEGRMAQEVADRRIAIMAAIVEDMREQIKEASGQKELFGAKTD